MSNLGQWLRWQLEKRGVTQQVLAVNARVASATISGILNHDHMPKVEILFRLADYFQVSREEILRAAGHLPPRGEWAGPADEDHYLLEELVQTFREIPEEWRPEALAQLQLLVKLANHPPAHSPAKGQPPPGGSQRETE
jgi:transcriptional regulator with XRE-family HTH domain